MNVIFPKQVGGRWYVEGPATDALPYYFNKLGMTSILERLAAEIPNSESGFKLSFSNQPFPEQKIALIRMEQESG